MKITSFILACFFSGIAYAGSTKIVIQLSDRGCNVAGKIPLAEQSNVEWLKYYCEEMKGNILTAFEEYRRILNVSCSEANENPQLQYSEEEDKSFDVFVYDPCTLRPVRLYDSRTPMADVRSPAMRAVMDIHLDVFVQRNRTLSQR